MCAYEYELECRGGRLIFHSCRNFLVCTYLVCDVQLCVPSSLVVCTSCNLNGVPLIYRLYILLFEWGSTIYIAVISCLQIFLFVSYIVLYVVVKGL